jgi:hypothetical protein
MIESDSKFNPLTVALVVLLMAAAAFLILAVFHDVSGTVMVTLPSQNGMQEDESVLYLNITYWNGTQALVNGEILNFAASDEIVQLINEKIAEEQDGDLASDTEEADQSSSDDSDEGSSGSNDGGNDNTGDQNGDELPDTIDQPDTGNPSLGIIPEPNDPNMPGVFKPTEPSEPEEPTSPTDSTSDIYHCEASYPAGCPYFNST